MREEKDITQALIYSVKNINSLDLVKEFKPTGTKNLAKITLNKPIQEAEKIIINHVEKELEKLSI